jgi:tRNA(Ile)-lysidine synthase
LYKRATGDLKKKLCKQKGKELHIPVKQLLAYKSRALIFSIIGEYGFAEKQIDEVLKLAESDSGKFIQSPAAPFRIIRHRHWFIISPAKDPEAATIVIEKDDKKIAFDSASLALETISVNNPTLKAGNEIATLDNKEIEFPLLLRKWKQGDYFYPLGMKKKKKIARFLIDQKLSKTTKENIWVLEMNSKIVWIVGQRIDDRFKVTEKTKDILKITVQT